MKKTDRLICFGVYSRDSPSSVFGQALRLRIDLERM